MPKIKNIIIFLAIGAAFVLIYIFFIKPSPAGTGNLVSSGENLTTSDSILDTTAVVNTNGATTTDFLNLLLNVENIKLNDAIFSDKAFLSLHDPNIVLVPDGNEGRVNPFASIGSDVVVVPPPTCELPKILNISTNTCVTLPPICALPRVLNPTTNTCVTPAVCALPRVLNSTTNTCINPSAN